MGRAEDIFERISREGEYAIDEFILTRKSEELFLDFKRSADNGGGSRLHLDDRSNLGRAVSGFANSEGGVIVWGVDCRRDASGADVARCKHPLVDIAAFVSWLEGSVSGCTMPACSGVRSIPVPTSGIGSSGFAATYVPKSARAPHQDLLKGGHYYIRAGSDFSPAPYGVLAGLFGKRPEPFIFHQLYIEPVHVSSEESAVHATIGFILVSDGPGIARDLFVTIDIFHPGGKSSISLEHGDQAVFDCYRLYGGHFSVVSKDGFKLPPGGRVHALTMRLKLIAPFTRDAFYMDVNYGCSGAPTRQKIVLRDSTTLQLICNTIADLPEAERTDFFTKEFLGELGPGELNERVPMVSTR